MTKSQFLDLLKEKLAFLPEDDLEDQLDFYSEMIDDRIDDGLSQEDAISEIGSIEDIVAQIKNSSADLENTDKPIFKRSLKTWEIILLIIGSPIWISLGLAALSVALSLYTAIWSVIISLWAAFGALAGCSLSVVVGIGLLTSGDIVAGIAMMGAGMLCAGTSIFLFFGCNAATNGVVLLTKKLISAIIGIFRKKEKIK